MDIRVPADASGVYKARIKVQEQLDGIGVLASACGPVGFGSVHDFELRVGDVTPLTIITNAGASVVREDAAPLKASQLLASDDTGEVTYSVTDGTSCIQFAGVGGGAFVSTFTQTDINNGLIEMRAVQCSAFASAVSMSLQADDGAGNMLPLSFAVQV